MSYKKKYTINNIQRYALNYISKFGTSKNYLTQFLIKKIKSRFIIESLPQLTIDVEEVVNKLVNLGYINDIAFCESRIKGLLKEGNSIFNIIIKLQQKQISKIIIEEAFYNIINQSSIEIDYSKNNKEELETYSLLKYAKKRNLLLWQNNHQYNIQKAYIILQRKGFNFTLINNIINKTNLLNTSYEDFTTYISNIEYKYSL